MQLLLLPRHQVSLRMISKPRSNGTQARTFTYTGALLTSVTNPENGTVTAQFQRLRIIHETLHMWLQGSPPGTIDSSLAKTLGLGAFNSELDASWSVTKALQKAHCY